MCLVLFLPMHVISKSYGNTVRKLCMTVPLYTDVAVCVKALFCPSYRELSQLPYSLAFTNTIVCDFFQCVNWLTITQGICSEVYI